MCCFIVFLPSSRLPPYGPAYRIQGCDIGLCRTPLPLPDCASPLASKAQTRNPASPSKAPATRTSSMPPCPETVALTANSTGTSHQARRCFTGQPCIPTSLIIRKMIPKGRTLQVVCRRTMSKPPAHSQSNKWKRDQAQPGTSHRTASGWPRHRPRAITVIPETTHNHTLKISAETTGPGVVWPRPARQIS